MAFRAALALARRALRTTLRRPQFLAPLLIFPSLFLAINTGGLHRSTDLPGFPHVHGFLDFQLAAAMCQSLMLGGVGAGIATALEIEGGFFDRLVASPIPRVSIPLGRIMAGSVIAAIQVVYFLALGLIFGAHIAGGVAGALIVLALLGLAATAFGGLGAALAIKAGRASVVQGIFPIVFVILFLSSAFFPRQLMKEPASTIAGLNPLSLIANGVRHPIIDGVSLHSIGTALAGIGIVAVIGWGLTALALRSRLRAV
jgi:ABC-2 type transport system permease protein